MRTRGKRTIPLARRRAPSCPEGYYTRNQVRDRLGLTEREIRRLVAADVVHSDRQNESGYALYSEGQMQTLLNRQADGSLFLFDGQATTTKPPTAVVITYQAEEGIRVFEMIEQGLPPHRIAIEARLHPRVVDQIRYDYDQMAGAMTIPKSILDQINRLQRLPGSFPLRSPTDVLEVMRAAEEERTCPTCQKRASAADCAVCIKAELDADREAEREPTANGSNAARKPAVAMPGK